MSTSFVSEPLSLAPLRENVVRVDVELHGVDTAVPSYEGRIFLDNPAADRETGLSEDTGYLGSFHVFGKVECWGEDDDHCAPATDRRFDRRRPPGRHKKVRVTIPSPRWAAALERAGDTVVISILAVQPEDTDAADDGPLRIDRLSFVGYG